MNRRSFLSGAASIGALVALAACGDTGAAPAAAGSTAGPGSGPPASGAQRIVIAGGALAEIAFALGAGGDVVGADTSCTFPEEVKRLPKVGYQRKLSAEGVLSLRPTLLLASDEAGPPEAISQIEGAGVRVARFGAVTSVEAAVERLRAVGAALGRADEGKALAEKLAADVAAARAEIEALPGRPRALFVFSRGPGMAMVGGKGTPAAAMIALAGGVNAAEQLDGFQAISAESVIAAAPEVVVLSSAGLASVGGESGLFALPGLSATPAARDRRLASIDDGLLLGFGPRLGEALRALGKALRASPAGER